MTNGLVNGNQSLESKFGERPPPFSPLPHTPSPRLPPGSLGLGKSAYVPPHLRAQRAASSPVASNGYIPPFFSHFVVTHCLHTEPAGTILVRQPRPTHTAAPPLTPKVAHPEPALPPAIALAAVATGLCLVLILAPRLGIRLAHPSA